MKRVARSLAGLLIAAAAIGMSPASARADVEHVVARGHTILSIAHRYHVSVKAILEANHLKDATHLKVGSTLVIPGAVAAPSGAGKKGKILEKDGKKALVVSYHQRPKTPGVVHATRLSTNEDYTIKVAHRGHVSPTALKSFERMMRNGAGLTHPIEPRLAQLVATVSDHFGSRRLEIISGFRPYTSTQYTKHSNHNVGHAIDFRVVGVPNEVLRDYCRTLHNVGVGYYPNSTFVHLDVRTSPAFWIDYSHPGEPPRYNSPNAEADEGTSDVSDDGHAPETSIMPDAPAPGAAPAVPSGLNPPPPGASNPDPAASPVVTMGVAPAAVPSPVASPAQRPGAAAPASSPPSASAPPSAPPSASTSTGAPASAAPSQPQPSTPAPAQAAPSPPGPSKP